MPNFDTSNLATAQLIADEESAKYELRQKPSPVFDLLSANGNFLYQNADAIRTREDRDADIFLFARTRRAAGSSRTYNHTGTIDDTFKVTPAFTTKSDKFKITLKLNDSNVFDFNRTFANKMMQACMNVLEAKETEIAAWLATNRSQVSQVLKLGDAAVFNTSTHCIDVTAANQKMFYNLVKSAMRQNYYRGTYDVIADNLAFVDAEYLSVQGAGNEANLTPQFAGLTFVESNEIADENYTQGMLFILPSRSAGCINWIPKQNRTGWGDYMSYVGGYGTFDYMGYTFAVHGYANRADTSSANGDTQDVAMEFEVSLDSSFNSAPISGGNSESSIFQAGLV